MIILVQFETNKHFRRMLAFEKFTYTYLFQIALEIM